jgi:ADP-ribose pyrophosphatase YjhB (NUDIX family)
VVYSLNGTEPFWLSGKHLINEAHTGILMFRLSGHKPTVLLVHPGGPFWQNKDRNSWSIPKDEFGDDATAETAAVREFEEETGFRVAIFQVRDFSRGGDGDRFDSSRDRFVSASMNRRFHIASLMSPSLRARAAGP